MVLFDVTTITTLMHDPKLLFLRHEADDVVLDDEVEDMPEGSELFVRDCGPVSLYHLHEDGYLDALP